MPGAADSSNPTGTVGGTEDRRPVPVLGQVARDALLAIARSSIAAAIEHEGTASHTLDLELLPAELRAHAGAFVTLTEDGELRGCIGSLDPDLPLARSVADAAVSAALGDPRFWPVDGRELVRLHLDVSVLGPFVPLPDVAAFRPGVDGILLEIRGRRAIFLPEVATDYGWGAEELFGALSAKAGLRRDAWRESGARLSVFRTVRFGGPALAANPA